MSFVTGSVSYSKPVDLIDTSTVLKLVQAEDSATGLITSSAIASSLLATLQDMAGDAASVVSYSIDCGVNADGSINTVFYAYIYDDSRPFRIETTNGTIVLTAIESSYAVTELLTFSSANTLELQYPCNHVQSFVWKNTVLDSGNNKVYNVTHDTDKFSVTLSEKVYGVAEITYLTRRNVYQLRSTQIPDATENIFDSVVYAYYDGGVEWLEITMPEGSDNFADPETECGYHAGSAAVSTIVNPDYGGAGSQTYIEKGDDGKAWPPKHPGGTTDKKIYIDYCTQEITRETLS